MTSQFLDRENIKSVHVDFLWKAFVKGKRWAFTRIYEENYTDLYYYGIKFITSHEEVKDLIHDLFVKLWNNKSNLSKPLNIKAYLLRSLRALILDYIKIYKNKFQESSIQEDPDFISISPEELFILNQTEQNNLRKLKEEIDKLPSRQKEAVYLHFIKEYSYKEVSQIMNINIQSARNFVFEALSKLKEKKTLFL